MADAPDVKADPSKKAADRASAVDQAIQRPDVPKIYANGFSVALSNADMMVVFQRYGDNPVAVVNLSYTLAKTLAQRLGQAVQEFESKIDQTILTTDRIDQAFKMPPTGSKQKPDDIH